MGDAGLAGIASLNAADAEEFFAAAFEIGFDGFDVGRRHHEDHANPQVEGLQQFVCLNFSELSQIFEDARDRPGGEIDLCFDSRRQNAGQISRDAPAGDMGQSGNPAARDDILERRGVTQMRRKELRANLVSDFGDVSVRLQTSHFKNEFSSQ